MIDRNALALQSLLVSLLIFFFSFRLVLVAILLLFIPALGALVWTIKANTQTQRANYCRVESSDEHQFGVTLNREVCIYQQST